MTPTAATVPSSGSTPVSIMILPNEILREIFSFMIPISIWGNIDDDNRRHIFTLRSVCRTFRALVNSLDFWWYPQFDLFDLMPGESSRWHTPEIRDARGSAFFDVLFQDSHLAERLGRRKGWNFTSFT